MDCVFCKIANGEIKTEKLYEDEKVVAFYDVNPVAPVHVLLIPRKHIAGLMDLEQADLGLVSHIIEVVQKLAVKLNIAEDGFRLLVNTKENGGQTVFHMHWHLIGGRFMEWPPG